MAGTERMTRGAHEPRVAPALSAAWVEAHDECIVLNCSPDGVCSPIVLRHTAADIWKLLAKNALTPREICERLSASYQVDTEDIMADVDGFISGLRAHRIISVVRDE